MEEISVFIGRHEIKLGDKMSLISGLIRNAYSEISGTDIIEMIYMPIASYSYIMYKGNKYKDVKSLMEANGIIPNQTIIFCGEDDYIEALDIEHVDLSTCPFECTSKEECLHTCNSIEIYRGKETIGFDIAQVSNSHCPDYILIAIPGKAYAEKGR